MIVRSRPSAGPSAGLAAATLALCLAGGLTATPADAQTFGGFGAPVNVTASVSSLGIITNLAAGDLNADGFVDLAVGSANFSATPVFLGVGDGTFLPPTFHGSFTSADVALVDVNADSVLDLIRTNSSFSNAFSVSIGQGDGSFAAETSFTLTGIFSTLNRIRAADLDADGDVDLVLARIAVGVDIAVALGAGDGTFTQAPSVTQVAGTFNMFDVGDVTGDGVPDLINAGGQAISIHPGVGDGTFSSPTSLPTPITSFQPNDTALADLDLDGDLDMIVSHSVSGGLVYVYLNDGAGGFGAPLGLGAGPSPWRFVVADLDGDGVPDLAVTNRASPGTVSILFGVGDGTFAAAQAFSTGFALPGPIVVADADGNAAPDLYIGEESSSGNGDVTLLLNMTDVLAPSAFALVSPPDATPGLPTPEVLASWPGGGGPARLTWGMSTGFSTTYTLTIATDPGLTGVVLQQSGLTGTSFDIPSGVLSAGQDYYWSVTAVNTVGATVASPGVFTFGTASTADLNNDGKVNGSDITFILNLFSP